MRKHRVNLNLLCDHDMAAFLSNTQLVVQQLQDVAFISLFITELRSSTDRQMDEQTDRQTKFFVLVSLFLREEDVTQTMYPTKTQSGNESQNQHQSSGGSSKVNLVCDALLEVLTSLGENK